MISKRRAALAAHDKAIDQWLRQQVVAAYDAMKADPSRARSVADVRKSLAQKHEQANALETTKGGGTE